MKLAIQTILFATENITVAQMLDAAEWLGVDGVEFYHRPDQLYTTTRSKGNEKSKVCGIAELIGMLKKRNLQFLGMAGGTIKERLYYCLSATEDDLLHYNLTRKDCLPEYFYLEEIPFSDSDPSGEDYRQCIDLGITLAVHPHFQTPIERVDKVDTSTQFQDNVIKLIPDTAHQYLAGEDPVTVLKQTPHSKIASVHIKDWDEASGRGPNSYAEGFTDIGQGNVPIAECIQELLRSEFTGWVVFEQDYPRDCVSKTLTRLRAYLTEELNLDLKSTGRPLPYKDSPNNSGPWHISMPLTQPDLIPINPIKRLEFQQSLAEVVGKLFGERDKASPTILWQWNSSMRTLTAIASSGLSYNLSLRADQKMVDSLHNSGAFRTGSSVLNANLLLGTNWSKFFVATNSRFMAVVVVANQFNPQQQRYFATAFMDDSNFKSTDDIASLINQGLFLTNSASRQHASGTVRYLAGQHFALSSFLEALQRLICDTLSCDSASFFLEGASRDRLEARTRNVIWHPNTGKHSRYYSSSESGKYRTATCWKTGQLLYLQRERGSSNSWKSAEFFQDQSPSLEDLSVSQGDDLLLIPIRGIVADGSAGPNLPSVIGVLRLRNYFIQQGKEQRRPFTPDDAELANIILEAAGAHICLLLGRERMSKRISVMTHEILSPITAAKASLAEIRSFSQELATAKEIQQSKLVRQISDYAEDSQSWLELVVRNVDSVKLIGPGIDTWKPEFKKWFMMADIIAPIKPSIQVMLRERNFEVRKIIYDSFNAIPKLYCDRNLMQQVFFNLLSNSVKYAYRSRPEAFAVNIESSAEPDFFRIDFQDNGPGIPIHDKEAVFEETYRGSSAAATESGLGIGLWVVRRIVAKHGGTVSVTDHSEGSFTVSVFLPRWLEHRAPD